VKLIYLSTKNVDDMDALRN